ncbi:MAG: hypothetical protein ABI772_03085 [Bacteroidota bacterium]
MRNTTKLKHLLQLYTLTFDMDEDEKIILTAIHKRSQMMETFADKSYSTVVGKAFSFMMREIKKPL